MVYGLTNYVPQNGNRRIKFLSVPKDIQPCEKLSSPLKQIDGIVQETEISREQRGRRLRLKMKFCCPEKRHHLATPSSRLAVSRQQRVYSNSRNRRFTRSLAVSGLSEIYLLGPPQIKYPTPRSVGRIAQSV